MLPHTAPLGLPDALARRVARNTQLVLLEESNLARVADPAAGSGALEAMTQQLCVAAWSIFQDIEKAGGAWAALEAGLIQRKVAAVRAERQKAVAQRKDILTGSNGFADLQETVPAVLDVAPLRRRQEAAATVTVEPLPRIRLAEPFERLRETSDTILARTRRAAESFSRHARHRRGLHRARDVRQELLRGRRHRGGERPCCRSQNRRRSTRLPVLVRQSLRQRRRRRGCGAQSGRRPPHLSCRPAGRTRNRAAGRRRAVLHLRGLRRTGDTAGRLRYSWPDTGEREGL